MTYLPGKGLIEPPFELHTHTHTNLYVTILGIDTRHNECVVMILHANAVFVLKWIQGLLRRSKSLPAVDGLMKYFGAVVTATECLQTMTYVANGNTVLMCGDNLVMCGDRVGDVHGVPAVVLPALAHADVASVSNKMVVAEDLATY